MANKVIIGILVLLLVVMGGIGYYSYTLNQQIDFLNSRLTNSEAGQTARIDAVTNELINLRTETQNGFNTLTDKITETLAEIATLKKEVVATQNQTAGLESKMNGVTSQIDNLNERITGFSGAVIDAAKVYQKVSQATVRIGNGENTAGSGFIMDTAGHVMTAYHVVQNLSQIYVTLHDGKVYKATSTGFCVYSDIAVLKLDGTPSSEPLPLADSSKIKIGEPVVAIGSPFDLRDTFTAGIVSQVNRYSDIESRPVANLIQFDAPVNPGNSGGPLINAAGEVVGIVVARIGPDTGDGIYWAVSSNKAKRVATAIIAQGHFDYPWIGVVISNLTPQQVLEKSLETANGVLVAGTVPNSPASTAGIKVDDIILSVDDIQVKDSADLTSYLGEFKSPGDVAKIKLIHGGTQAQLSVNVTKRLQ